MTLSQSISKHNLRKEMYVREESDNLPAEFIFIGLNNCLHCTNIFVAFIHKSVQAFVFTVASDCMNCNNDGHRARDHAGREETHKLCMSHTVISIYIKRIEFVGNFHYNWMESWCESVCRTD